MIRLGLTGGVCCGKTTALGIFQACGFETINLEQYIHRILQGKIDVKQDLTRTFGSSCLDRSTGQLSMDQLSNMIFASADSLQRMESILYSRLDGIFSDSASPFVVVEIPLLFEKKLESYFDRTICVYSTYPLQLSRAKNAYTWSRKEFDRQQRSQLSLAEKITRADFVLGNNGLPIQLRRQIQLLIQKLQNLDPARGR